MTNTTNVAQDLALAIPAYAERWADNQPEDLFACMDEGADLRARHQAVIRRATGWVSSDLMRNRPHAVVISVEGADDDKWGYVAAAILDLVAADLLPADVQARANDAVNVPTIIDLADGRSALCW